MNIIPSSADEIVAVPSPDRRRARGEATRSRILDAAEELFAARGFEGVSLREVATAAGVELSLIGHHFGSKALLGENVLMRRSQAVFESLRLALDRVEARGSATARDVLDAYVGTFLVAVERNDQGTINYLKLLLKRADEVDDLYARDRPLMAEYIPLRRRYVRALQGTAPACDKVSAAFAMTMAEAALGYALVQRSPKAFENVTTRSRRIAQMLRRLTPFLAAGLEAGAPVIAGDLS